MMGKRRFIYFLLTFLLILSSVGCGTTTSPTDNIEDSFLTSTIKPTETTTTEPTETTTTEPTETTTTELTETTTTEPTETTTTELTETTTTEPTETTTTEPTTTTSVPETRMYKSRDFYYQISYPISLRIEINEKFDVFFNSDNGSISIHVDRLTVDESAESYFNSILEGENENITHVISEPLGEIPENDVIIGYEFDCSNVVDENDHIGKGIILKKGSFGFFVAFTSPEAAWEENEEIALECLDSFTLPPIYTGSYTNSELGISLVLPDNWSLIETDSTSTPVEVFSNTGIYVERLSMSWMRQANGKLKTYSVEPGTTAEEYMEKKSDGAEQTPFTFANSAVGCEYGMALNANDETIAEFRHIALVVGSKVYYFEFIGVPDMDTLFDSVTELARSLVISSQ